MAQQVITYEDKGGRADQILTAITPQNSELAPAVNADYLGQVHVDTAAGTIYQAIATDSVTPGDDWLEVSQTAVVAAVALLQPLTGVTAPAAQSDFIGQTFIDTVAPAVYKSVAIDSVTPADDWVLVTTT